MVENISPPQVLVGSEDMPLYVRLRDCIPADEGDGYSRQNRNQTLHTYMNRRFLKTVSTFYHEDTSFTCVMFDDMVGNPISCAFVIRAAVAVSESCLLLGREDGTVCRYTLPHISLENRSLTGILHHPLTRESRKL